MWNCQFFCALNIESVKNTTPHDSFSGNKHSNKSYNIEIQELIFPSEHNKYLRKPSELVAAAEGVSQGGFPKQHTAWFVGTAAIFPQD